MQIPVPIMKFVGKAGNWLVKNGPKIMSVAGGAMAVGGAVMACEATLHADEVLDRHKQKMAKIEAAKRLSDETAEEVEDVYTEKMMKRDKAIVWAETTRDFIKLYAPAVSVGLSGVALMQGAFWMTEHRRAAAVSALTTVNQMYQNLLEKQDAASIGYLDNPEPKLLPAKEEGEEPEDEVLVLDPTRDTDPFFFVFDKTNPNWADGNGFVLNERFITATLDAFNYRLSSHAVDHVWINDILKAFDMREKDYGGFYGYNSNTGDIIEYEIVPFMEIWDDENADQMPMLVETDMETLRELETCDVQDGYCIGVRLKSSSDGYDGLVDPRFIYNEVYGR